MGNPNFEHETHIVYDAMKQYEKAYRRYSKGYPSPQAAKLELDREFNAYIAAIRNRSVADRIDKVAAARDDELLENGIRREDVEMEIRLTRFFFIKYRRVRKEIEPRLVPKPTPKNLKNRDEVIVKIIELQNQIISEMDKSRGIPSRVQKKKRKKNIRRAVWSTIFGSGCLIANSYAIGMDPGTAAAQDLASAGVSVGMALTAFHEAGKDIVGESGD